MKTLLLLVLLVAACSGTSPMPTPDGAAGASGAGGASYPTCPQHRVEGVECPSPTGGVLGKDGRFCASCSGVDDTGTPTAKPIGCTTIAGGDLCVAACGECS